MARSVKFLQSGPVTLQFSDNAEDKALMQELAFPFAGD
jgi:environmental stress-induced protein Ves